MSDWLHIARLDDNVPLDIDRHPMGEHSPLRDAISTHLAASGYRTLSFVAEEDKHIVGLGQSVPRQTAWNVARLMTTSSLSPADETTVLTGLLNTIAQAVAEHGAMRLHARVQRDAAANDAFVRASFTPYSYESVYFLPSSPTRKATMSGLPIRPQESKDAWGIYQLYCAITPRLVQQAEGLDASHWDIPPSTSMRRLSKVGEHRWVLEIDGEIVGFVRTNRLGRRLQMLIAPSAYRYARQMIAYAIAEMTPIHYVRCSLPEYQGELGTHLEEEGFRFVGTQVVFVRQLTAVARSENRVVRSVLELTLGSAHTISPHYALSPCGNYDSN